MLFTGLEDTGSVMMTAWLSTEFSGKPGMKAVGWLPVRELGKGRMDADVGSWVQVVRPCVDLYFIK